MQALYPLLLLPEFHQRPWGTRDLSPIYSEPRGDEPIGEAWLTGDACCVANGPLAGSTLGQLARQYGRELVGEAAPQAERFPLLLKFLVPREKLSVQVHPDDAMARRQGEACGKTECWYVLSAEPGAQVALGFRAGTRREQIEAAIRETRLEELLNWIDIHPGELIYVEAGTVHAIGPGSVLLETQQNSDTTYRLYDYGRSRALHLEEGLEAAKLATGAGKVKAQKEGQAALLVSSPSFQVRRRRLEGRESYRQAGGGDSAQVLVAMEGCGRVESPGCDAVTMARGEAVVIPAAVAEFTVTPQWELELLTAAVPASKVPPPETTLEFARGGARR
jgi:mannose-6-phosphate isomerase